VLSEICKALVKKSLTPNRARLQPSRGEPGTGVRDVDKPQAIVSVLAGGHQLAGTGQSPAPCQMMKKEGFAPSEAFLQDTEKELLPFHF
jgi:hypothetical protein